MIHLTTVKANDLLQKNCNILHHSPEATLHSCSYKKNVLKIRSKYTREHPCRSMISIKLLCNFIEIALWHGCSPVNLLHIFRAYFFTSAGLLLTIGTSSMPIFLISRLIFSFSQFKFSGFREPSVQKYNTVQIPIFAFTKA